MRQVAFALVAALMLAFPAHAEPVFRGLSWGDPVEALGDVESVPLRNTPTTMCYYVDGPSYCYHHLEATDLAQRFVARDSDPRIYDDSLAISVYADLLPDKLGAIQPKYILYLVADGELVGISVHVDSKDEDDMLTAMRIRYGEPYTEASSQVTWVTFDEYGSAVERVDWSRGAMIFHSPVVWARYRV